LLELGVQLMDESEPVAGVPISKDDAVLYRDGLMIALLAFIPLRRKNLVSLEIGRHLVQEGDAWFVIIPHNETKTGKPIDFLFTTHVMQRPQTGLFRRPIRSALPAICLRTAICAPRPNTTIGREGSKPAEHIVR
jgi:hypothetical protein